MMEQLDGRREVNIFGSTWKGDVAGGMKKPYAHTQSGRTVDSSIDWPNKNVRFVWIFVFSYKNIHKRKIFILPLFISKWQIIKFPSNHWPTFLFINLQTGQPFNYYFQRGGEKKQKKNPPLFHHTHTSFPSIKINIIIWFAVQRV